MRLMLDTCVIIDLLTDADSLSKGVTGLLEDPENTLHASCESMRELVVHFNNKKLLNRYFKTSTEVLQAVLHVCRSCRATPVSGSIATKVLNS